MSFVGQMLAKDVCDAPSYAAYVQQTCGTPYCNQKDMILLRKAIKDFIQRYPHLAENPWPTLIRAAQWVRSKRKRPAKVHAVVNPMIAWAWQDGALPELDPTRHQEPETEIAIGQALLIEEDPVWRNRLMNSEGAEVRREVLTAWEMHRLSPSPGR